MLSNIYLNRMREDRTPIFDPEDDSESYIGLKLRVQRSCRGRADWSPPPRRRLLELEAEPERVADTLKEARERQLARR